MTWPLVNPASGYISLSRFDSESLRSSISTSWRLATATRKTLLTVQIEPDGGLRLAPHAPSARERRDEVEPDPAAAGEVGRSPRRRAGPVIRIRDLDVHAGPPALQSEVQLRAGARAAVTDAVGDEL